MDKKKIFWIAGLSVILSGAIPSINADSVLMPTLHAAERQMEERKDTQKMGDLDVRLPSSEYKVINDATKSISEDEVKNISSELNQIFSQTTLSDGKVFRMYTFIYDSANKGLDEATAEVMAGSDISPLTRPVIFIYNKNTKEYKYIVDKTIASYVSPSFLKTLTEKNLVQQDLNAKTLEETILRGTSSISMSIMTNAKIKDEAWDKKHFDVREINAKDGSISSSDSAGNSALSDNAKPQEKKKEEDNTSLFAGIGALLLALGSIFVIFYRRKKKQQRRQV